MWASHSLPHWSWVIIIVTPLPPLNCLMSAQPNFTYGEPQTPVQIFMLADHPNTAVWQTRQCLYIPNNYIHVLWFSLGTHINVGPILWVFIPFCIPQTLNDLNNTSHQSKWFLWYQSELIISLPPSFQSCFLELCHHRFNNASRSRLWHQYGQGLPWPSWYCCGCCLSWEPGHPFDVNGCCLIGHILCFPICVQSIAGWALVAYQADMTWRNLHFL